MTKKLIVIAIVFISLSACKPVAQTSTSGSIQPTKLVDTQTLLTNTPTKKVSPSPTINLPTVTNTPVPPIPLPLVRDENLPIKLEKLKFGDDSNIQLLRIIRDVRNTSHSIYLHPKYPTLYYSSVGDPWSDNTHSFDLETGTHEKRTEQPHRFDKTQLSPDGNWLILCNPEIVRIEKMVGASITSSTEFLELPRESSDSSSIQDFSADGKVFWIKEAEMIHFYETSNWAKISSLKLFKKYEFRYPIILPGNTSVGIPGKGVFLIKNGDKQLDPYDFQHSTQAFMDRNAEHLLLLDKKAEGLSLWNLQNGTVEANTKVLKDKEQYLIGIFPDASGYLITDGVRGTVTGISFDGKELLSVYIPYAGKRTPGPEVKFTSDGTMMIISSSRTRDTGTWGGALTIRVYGGVPKSNVSRIQYQKANLDTIPIYDNLPQATFVDYGIRSPSAISAENFMNRRQLYLIDPARELGGWSGDFSEDSNYLVQAEFEKGYYMSLDLRSGAVYYFFPDDDKAPENIELIDNDTKVVYSTYGYEKGSNEGSTFIREFRLGKPERLLHAFPGCVGPATSGDGRYIGCTYVSIVNNKYVRDLRVFDISDGSLVYSSPRGVWANSGPDNTIECGDEFLGFPEGKPFKAFSSLTGSGKDMIDYDEDIVIQSITFRTGNFLHTLVIEVRDKQTGESTFTYTSSKDIWDIMRAGDLIFFLTAKEVDNGIWVKELNTLSISNQKLQTIQLDASNYIELRAISPDGKFLISWGGEIIGVP